MSNQNLLNPSILKIIITENFSLNLIEIWAQFPIEMKLCVEATFHDHVLYQNHLSMTTHSPNDSNQAKIE